MRPAGASSAGRRFAALALACAAAAGGAAPARAQTFTPCTPAGVQCATVTVPLDRTRLVPGTVSLAVRRLTGSSPGSGVLVALAGGPGASAIFEVEGLATELRSLLGGRDLVVFDVRGVGLSDPITCPGLSRATADACAARLGPARAFYRTTDTADDLEAVRSALGVDRISLYAESYATAAAYDYAARYPQHVDRVVLDSPVPPHGFDALVRSTGRAVDRVLRVNCRFGCHGANPVADVARVAPWLGSRGRSAPLIRPSGRPTSFTLTEPGLWATLLESDRNPAMRLLLPAALHAARVRDLGPLMRLDSLMAQAGQSGAPASGTPFSETINTVTLCEETPMPWARDSSVDVNARVRALIDAFDRQPHGTYGPFDPVQFARGSSPAAQCLKWPQSARVPTQGDAGVPAAPVLVLSGDSDMRTPLEDAQALTRSLPNGALLEVEQTGHGVIGSVPHAARACLERALTAFGAGGAAGGVCRVDSLRVTPLPVPPRSLAALAPAPGVRGLPGRTLAAVVATLADAQVDGYAALYAGDGTSIAEGGLRGGLMRGTAKILRLQRLVFVPGVTVTGTMDIETGTATVKVSGSGAHGRVTITADRLIAALGRVHVNTKRPRGPVDNTAP
ncbi:MAG TPA: alpha/beta fold hydrolase [Solirubrobacteraceae bacterium]|nr:alpha/beta fold hydrolase [Solirubrobacteraceae bacterium]